jgi:hypothetical protein
MKFHAAVVEELKRRVASGAVRPGEVAKLLNLPASRVSEIIGGRRLLKADEAFQLAGWWRMDPFVADMPDDEDGEMIVRAALDALPADFTQEERASAIWRGLQVGVRILTQNPDLSHHPDALRAVLRATREYLQ